MQRNFVLRFTRTCAGAGVALFLASSGCRPKAGSEADLAAETLPAVRVSTVEVREAQMPVYATFTGSLRPKREARIASSGAGRLVKIHFDRGDKVKAGQVLAELDSSTASLSAAESAKAAQSAKLQRENAKRECDRAKQLYEGGAISKAEMDAREAQCDSAELGVEAAGLRASLGAQMLRDAVVKAPFAGVIETRDTELGEYLMPGSRVATLVETEELRLEVVVPEAQLARVALDTAVRFRVAAHDDRSFTATVRVIGAMVRPGTRDVIVEAAVNNADGALKPGMFATVEIATAEAPLAVLPKSALVKRGDATHVFVVVDGRIHERVVKLGPERDADVGVVRGVAAGDKVVDKPAEDVKNGAAVSEG
jgi:membrane fusion protein (multidrug efflux system)